jgi:hypothetical protein
MMEAYGWVIVKSSRERYRDLASLEGKELSDRMDRLDAETSALDRQVWAQLRAWLSANADDPFLEYQFFEELNWASGILQFVSCRNHRASSSIWPLMDWIVRNAVGSYGLVYVHDDEINRSGRGVGGEKRDVSNEFRVWRILNGKLEELDDPFLSPIVPNATPPFS